MEALVYAILSKIFRIKFCTHFADPVPHSNSFFGKISFKKAYLIWNLCIRLSIVTIVISTGLKKIVLSLHPKAKTFIIPAMTSKDKGKNTSGYNDQITTIIEKNYLGRMAVYSEKFTVSSGIVELLESVKVSDGTWKLAITGPINKNSSRHLNIKDLISKMGLEDRVHYLGYLDRGLYHSLLSVANVLVVPKSLDVINSYNFPGKLVEFLETGKPVVAADVSDISLYLEDGSDIVLYNANNVDELGRAISKLIIDKDLAYSIGNNGKIMAALKFNNKLHMASFYKYMVRV